MIRCEGEGLGWDYFLDEFCTYIWTFAVQYQRTGVYWVIRKATKKKG